MKRDTHQIPLFLEQRVGKDVEGADAAVSVVVLGGQRLLQVRRGEQTLEISKPWEIRVGKIPFYSFPLVLLLKPFHLKLRHV